MWNRIKSAPGPVLVFFSLILLVELASFAYLLKAGPLFRFFLLAILMMMTLNRSRIARNILVFLLFVGALGQAISGSLSDTPIGLTLLLSFTAVFLLGGTALYLLLSKKFLTFLSAQPASIESTPEA